jgi:hypothetical protein
MFDLVSSIRSMRLKTINAYFRSKYSIGKYSFI